MPSIARVVVRLSLNREFDYRIPPALQGRVRVGTPVVVPFGKTQVNAYVVALRDQSPHAELKEIRSVIGKKSLISDRMLDLARRRPDGLRFEFEMEPRERPEAAERLRERRLRDRRLRERIEELEREVRELREKLESR